MSTLRDAGEARILVVEDDPGLLDLIRLVLMEQGYMVDAAATSQAALEKAHAGRYDLLLIDLMLPDADGVILHGKLKNIMPGIQDSTIFMTGFTAEGPVIDYLRKLGAAFLQKPFKTAELIETVTRIRERQQPH